MTTALPSSTRRTPARWLQQAWAFNRPLTLTLLLNLALIPFILAGLVLDPKIITGVNGWIKPLKFTVSVVIYAGTFLWLLTLVQGRRRWVQAAANLTALALTVEIVLILVQVVRGTTSHFNVATPLDAAIFSTMGVLILMVACWTCSWASGSPSSNCRTRCWPGACAWACCSPSWACWSARS